MKIRNRINKMKVYTNENKGGADQWEKVKFM